MKVRMHSKAQEKLMWKIEARWKDSKSSVWTSKRGSLSCNSYHFYKTSYMLIEEFITWLNILKFCIIFSLFSSALISEIKYKLTKEFVLPKSNTPTYKVMINRATEKKNILFGFTMNIRVQTTEYSRLTVQTAYNQ